MANVFPRYGVRPDVGERGGVVNPVGEVRALLEAAAERLGDHSDRSDPVGETLLCLVECALEAARAADEANLGDSLQHRQEALAAARAAVTCASYAVVNQISD
jgi:hypothetical protein